MTAVAEIALELGLEVWFSPAFFEHSLEETAARLVAAAEAATPLAQPIRGVWSSSPAASSRSSDPGWSSAKA